MTNRPYDANLSAEDIRAAIAWWSNLSINQMKGLRDKHTTHFQWNGKQVPVYAVHEIPRGTIYQIWEEEGKPPPQALIAVS